MFGYGSMTKQNGVRLLGKFKKKFKKIKTDLPYLSFYKRKPETHIFFGPSLQNCPFLSNYMQGCGLVISYI